MADLIPGKRLFVVTYTPLIRTKVGRDAATTFKRLPPFIDGSIRREPDLQHRYPSISCLCRAGKFAPRLAVGDRVLYLTHKGRYGDLAYLHWRMTAVLKVVETCENHTLAAAWYNVRGLPLPSNCMVEGNDPMPLEQSHRKTSVNGCGNGQVLRLWDKEYKKRAAKWPRFVICRPVFRELWEPPVVRERDLKAAFGHVPVTQNPPAFPIVTLDTLMQRIGTRAAK
jgi:hypothetical protein